MYGTGKSGAAAGPYVGCRQGPVADVVEEAVGSSTPAGSSTQGRYTDEEKTGGYGEEVYTASPTGAPTHPIPMSCQCLVTAANGKCRGYGADADAGFCTIVRNQNLCISKKNGFKELPGRWCPVDGGCMGDVGENMTCQCKNYSTKKNKGDKCVDPDADADFCSKVFAKDACTGKKNGWGKTPCR